MKERAGDPWDALKRMPPRGWDTTDRVWGRIVEGDKWVVHLMETGPLLSEDCESWMLADPPELIGGHVLRVSGSVPGSFFQADGKDLLDDLVSLVEEGGGTPYRHDAQRFIRVRGEEVRRLFCRYGPLNWCSCKRAPAGHPASDPERCGPIRPEPMIFWWRLGHEVRAFLHLAADLHAGLDGRMEDWATIIRSPQQSHRLYTAEEFENWVEGCTWYPSQLLSSSIRKWSTLSDVQQNLRWPEGESPELRVYHASNPVYGAIAFHLALTACGIPGLARCSICKSLYPREQHPNPRRRNYCSEPCRRAGDALRKRQKRTLEVGKGRGRRSMLAKTSR